MNSLIDRRPESYEMMEAMTSVVERHVLTRTSGSIGVDSVPEMVNEVTIQDSYFRPWSINKMTTT